MGKVTWKCCSVLVAIVVIAAALPVLVENSFYVSEWDAAWIQAIGSVFAVLVAIYVPWKINEDRNKAEKARADELSRISGSAIAHELWVMKEFFVYSKYAVENYIEVDISCLSAGLAPIDTKSSVVIDPEKFCIIENLPNDIVEIYFKALSMRHLAISFMRSFRFVLMTEDRLRTTECRETAMSYCDQGAILCQSAIDKLGYVFDESADIISLDLDVFR
ncbi:hypothetical protein [Vreelandella titanicae]|uniref:hypothetical protein n=1 Tax=Vreelandella titanicae TaxID=664683 RepID=UPI0016819596|nr:hypothetical protein [Halomonas titanicae]QNU62263.1 hypothetical protein HZS52_21385 [Halomonas titanicae]